MFACNRIKMCLRHTKVSGTGSQRQDNIKQALAFCIIQPIKLFTRIQFSDRTFDSNRGTKMNLPPKFSKLNTQSQNY